MKRVLSLLFVLFSFSSVRAGSSDITVTPSVVSFLGTVTDFGTKGLGNVVDPLMRLKLKKGVSIQDCVDALDVYHKAQVEENPVQLFQVLGRYFQETSLQNKMLIGGGCLLVSISLASSVVSLCSLIKKRFRKKINE